MAVAQLRPGRMAKSGTQMSAQRKNWTTDVAGIRSSKQKWDGNVAKRESRAANRRSHHFQVNNNKRPEWERIEIWAEKLCKPGLGAKERTTAKAKDLDPRTTKIGIRDRDPNPSRKTDRKSVSAPVYQLIRSFFSRFRAFVCVSLKNCAKEPVMCQRKGYECQMC